MKRTFLFILVAFVTLLPACGVRERISYADEINTYEEDDSAFDSQSESKASFRADIYVYVTGCVVNPGVYIMPEGSRVYDAVNAAGGVTEEGDGSHMNMVNIIQDGEKINVPTAAEFSAEDASGTSGKVNINQATLSQLTGISGIGESKAKAIIAYREKHGSFSKKEDIMKVSGIKEGTFEKIKDYIEAY